MYQSLEKKKKLPAVILYRAEERLTTVSFANGNVLKIISSLNVNKARSHYISIRLLKIVKICDAEVVKPLSLIFKNCMQYELSPKSVE